MKRTSLIMALLGTALAASTPAAAQWQGMPIWNNPKGGTGVTLNGASSVYTATAGGMGVNAGGTCEIILGYAGSGGLSIAQAGVATHGNGVVLWVSGNSLYARHSNGADSLIS